jgi:hypothetical protein
MVRNGALVAIFVFEAGINIPISMIRIGNVDGNLELGKLASV